VSYINGKYNVWQTFKPKKKCSGKLENNFLLDLDIKNTNNKQEAHNKLI
jgi:hypothetical protein